MYILVKIVISCSKMIFRVQKVFNLTLSKLPQSNQVCQTPTNENNHHRTQEWIWQ